MRQHLQAAVLLAVLGQSAWAGGSWIFQPSTYSHDPETGERVAQHTPETPAYAPSDPTYEQSAYIHKRTAIYGAPGSIERRHYVETWGEGESIRPYGEWQRPFRAGATPYGPWGNPSGPWTTPFGSWSNPYGLGQLPTPPWSPWYPQTGYPPRPYPDAGYPGGAHPEPYWDYGRGPYGRDPGDARAPRPRDQREEAYRPSGEEGDPGMPPVRPG